MDKYIELIGILTVIVAGPMVGSEIAVAAFLNPLLDRLPDESFRVARSSSSRTLGKVMPFWYMGTLVLLVIAAVVTSGDWLIIAAAVLMALVVLLTVTMMVPINNRIGAWSSAADTSRDLARRWDRLHWVRVVGLLALFVLLVVAVV